MLKEDLRRVLIDNLTTEKIDKLESGERLRVEELSRIPEGVVTVFMKVIGGDILVKVHELKEIGAPPTRLPETDTWYKLHCVGGNKMFELNEIKSE